MTHTVYVHDLIYQLEASNYGCYVTGKFFGCIMYADDLLLSATVTGLQQMLNICYSIAQFNESIFTLSPERQSARMSKITNDKSGTGCFTAVPIWQQRA